MSGRDGKGLLVLSVPRASCGSSRSVRCSASAGIGNDPWTSRCSQQQTRNSPQLKNGAMREDLYHRLAVLQIRAPPLRERIEDTPALVGHFAYRHARQYETNPVTFTPEAQRCIARYHWPGKVRELANFVERSTILHAYDNRRDALERADFEAIFGSSTDIASLAAQVEDPQTTGDDQADALQLLDHGMIDEITHYVVNRRLSLMPTIVNAAVSLGVGASTLWRWRKRQAPVLESARSAEQ